MKNIVPVEKKVCVSQKNEFITNLRQIKDVDENNLNDPVCILGAPGVADIGKIALDHLIKALKAEKVLDITFSDYPAGAIINESLLYAPTAEVYFYKDPQQKHDLFLVTADAQPMSPRGIYAISEFIARIMANYNVNLILTLGGYPIERPNKDVIVYITATSKELLERFAKNEWVQTINKGVVIGVNGLVPTLAKRNFEIDGLVLLAETNGYAAMNGDTYDLKASLRLIEVINQELALTMDAEFTHKQIMGLEVKLNNEKETIKKELGLNSNSEKTSFEYIC
ncbi:MAG: PAC2 family protein [Candidatus Hodarchaeota archaeon]